MAKRTKRTTARKVKARRKLAKRGKIAKRQAAKRPVKAKPRRQTTKARPKRSVAKKAPITPTKPSTLQTETTIVDVIEEPVPGVVVVTECEETQTRGSDTTKQLGGNQIAGRPEPEEE